MVNKMLQKKILFSKHSLKTSFSKIPIIFKRRIKINFFFFNKFFIIAGGNRFIKKKIYVFDVSHSLGSFILSTKPFRKPILLKISLKI